MSLFSRNVLILSVILSGLITNTLENVAGRAPANADAFELTLQNLNTAQISKINGIKNGYLRVILNGKEVIEISKDTNINMSSDQSLELAKVIEIDPKWITQDTLEFRIELVEKSLFESVRLRCSTISRGLSVYNRSYQCSVPGEATTVLSYRVAKKGSPTPDTAGSVAKN